VIVDEMLGSLSRVRRLEDKLIVNIPYGFVGIGRSKFGLTDEKTNIKVGDTKEARTPPYEKGGVNGENTGMRIILSDGEDKASNGNVPFPYRVQSLICLEEDIISVNQYGEILYAVHNNTRTNHLCEVLIKRFPVAKKVGKTKKRER